MDRTVEELQKLHEQGMGPDLGRAYTELRNDLVWVNANWSAYKALYGSPESAELLNQTAPFFFWQVQDALWGDVVLRVARMTDPAVTARKKNLTIQMLPDHFPPELQGDMRALVEKTVKACAFVRDWRNRRLAHSDLDLKLGTHRARPLEPATRQDLEHVIELLATVLNRVQQAYFPEESTYYADPAVRGGAKVLLRRLRRLV